MRRVLVTGSRDWNKVDLLRQVLAEELALTPAGMIVVHGAARGADMLAHHWAEQTVGVTAEPHAADWGRYGPKAGPLRNQEMVDLGADICLAFLLPSSRGTRDCMRRAEAAGIRVVEFS